MDYFCKINQDLPFETESNYEERKYKGSIFGQEIKLISCYTVTFRGIILQREDSLQWFLVILGLHQNVKLL